MAEETDDKKVKIKKETLDKLKKIKKLGIADSDDEKAMIEKLLTYIFSKIPKEKRKDELYNDNKINLTKILFKQKKIFELPWYKKSIIDDKDCEEFNKMVVELLEPEEIEEINRSTLDDKIDEGRRDFLKKQLPATAAGIAGVAMGLKTEDVEAREDRIYSTHLNTFISDFVVLGIYNNEKERFKPFFETEYFKKALNSQKIIEFMLSKPRPDNRDPPAPISIIKKNDFQIEIELSKPRPDNRDPPIPINATYQNNSVQFQLSKPRPDNRDPPVHTSAIYKNNSVQFQLSKPRPDNRDPPVPINATYQNNSVQFQLSKPRPDNRDPPVHTSAIYKNNSVQFQLSKPRPDNRDPPVPVSAKIYNQEVNIYLSKPRPDNRDPPSIIQIKYIV